VRNATAHIEAMVFDPLLMPKLDHGFGRPFQSGIFKGHIPLAFTGHFNARGPSLGPAALASQAGLVELFNGSRPVFVGCFGIGSTINGPAHGHATGWLD
jgi:hypothetical protein